MKQERQERLPVSTATVEGSAASEAKCADITAKQEALARQMREFLRSWDVDFEQFQDCLNGLTEEGLRILGPEYFQFFYLNFLSVFGSESSVGTIKRVAVACTKFRLLSMMKNTNYLVRLIKDPDPTAEQALALTGWNVAQLKSLLALGRGLVICTAHIGAFRYIATDLVHMGFKVCMAVDTNTAARINKVVAISKTAKRSVALPHVCDVEHNRMGTLSLVRALERNEIVLVFVDGNLGIDGLFGSKSRCATGFLGKLVSVKSGAAQLACERRAPLVNLLSVAEEQGAGRIVCQVPIEMETFTSREEQEEFGHECTRSFYRAFETLIRQFPEQWESARFLHRWRTEVEKETYREQYRSEDAQRTIVSLLKENAHFRIDNQRVVVFSDREGTNLLNVETLRAYQVGPELQDMVAELSSRAGLSSAWIDAQTWGNDKRQEVVKVLARLRYLGSVA